MRHLVRIETFCDTGTGGTPSRNRADRYFSGGHIPWVKSGELREEVITSTEEYVTDAALDESNIKLVPAGAILLAMYGATVGRLALLGIPATTNQAICYIIPDPKRADTRYLFHTLRSSVPTLLARRVGGAQPNISQGIVHTLEVSLPPLPEQRRIAEILDKADALRAKRRAALAQLDTLTQSIFLDMFGGKLDAPPVDTQTQRSNVPRECSWVLLTDVARLATGHTPDRERPEYWGGEIPWISLTDIRSLDGTEATRTLQNVTPLGIEKSSAVLLPRGTVCFSRTASVGFVTVMGREMATSQDFMNWVCGPLLDPTYLMWALITSRRRLLALAPGSTHRTIYMRVVEQFRVLLPPINSQREFARQVAAISVLKKSLYASLAELDRLFASLQHRAFRGEL